MTTRRMMIAVAAVALFLCGIVGVNEMERRAQLFSLKAEYHRRYSEDLEAKAAYLEAVANNPLSEAELPSVLLRTGRWSRERALEMQLEASLGPPSDPRWKQRVSEAREDAILGAQAYRRASEHHIRARERCQRVAMDPWQAPEPDSDTPVP